MYRVIAIQINVEERAFVTELFISFIMTKVNLDSKRYLLLQFH
jgi:hypothetical protein